MSAETQLSAEEPHVTTLGRALALGVLVLTLMLSPLATALAAARPGLLLTVVHQFQTGDWGMWVILPAGVTLLLTFGLVQLFRPRVALWPLGVVPTLACVGSLVFVHRAAQSAAEVVTTPPLGVDAGQRLQIFADCASEALSTHLVVSLAAGWLLIVAASVLGGRALLGAERIAWSGAAARALAVGAGLTLACVAYAVLGEPPSRGAVAIAALGAGHATLLCTLYGLTRQPEASCDPLAARVSLWLSTAAIVAGLLCVVGSSEAHAQRLLFAAIGGGSVPDERAATYANEALQLSGWAKLSLPWLALLPAVIAGLTVPPTALKALLQARSLARERWLLAWTLALGVGAVGLGRYVTAASLELCMKFASAIVPTQFELVVASGGKPQAFGASNPQAWVGKASITVTQDYEPEANAPTAKLLEPECGLRLGPPGGYLWLQTLFVDASLTAKHIECLLPALFDLKPEREGAWENEPQYTMRRPSWGPLWRDNTQLPQPYAELTRRSVWLKMGIAAQRAKLHLELQDAYWDLQRGETRLRLEGALERRVASLRGALEGQAAAVSIASAPHVPAPFLLNAALAVSDAECEPQLWVRGYSVRYLSGGDP